VKSGKVVKTKILRDIFELIAGFWRSSMGLKCKKMVPVKTSTETLVPKIKKKPQYEKKILKVAVIINLLFIGCSLKFPVKVVIEESIVNEPLISLSST
jgi:hypothetical protein